MAISREALTVVALPGLSPHSLGNYLASLGLLRVLSRRWPNVRAAWRDGVFHMVGGPPDLDALTEAMMCVAEEGEWTPYSRDWKDCQKESTDRRNKYLKAKNKEKADSSFDRPLLEWQAAVGEEELEIFSAHVAPATRNRFNPLLGKGGSAGNRDFSDGLARAKHLLAGKGRAPDAIDRREHLHDMLLGRPNRWAVSEAPLFPDKRKDKDKKNGLLNAASWFSEANKLYNSGQQRYREGTISPWAMALACEGLPFFAGGASRRLGSRVPANGAFPFVVGPAGPKAAGEAGRDGGEVWAPIWNRPMTVAEVATLFSRGRAEIGGRGAVTPAAFAVAAIGRGADAGIAEFRRFALGRTTSANTFEPRFEGVVAVPQRAPAPISDGSPQIVTTALERLLRLLDSLPPDYKAGQRWRFVGLRGPIEEALVHVTAAPDDPEAACALLDAVVQALDRVDTNKTFRARNVRWEALPLEWLPVLFGGETPPAEARLTLALVSAFPKHRPFTLYRFGADLKTHRRFVHPGTAPARWAWRPGPLPQVLGQILHRRLLDWERGRQEADALEPARQSVAARLSDLEDWLAGRTDEALLVRWLSRLALFDWSPAPWTIRGELSSDLLSRLAGEKDVSARFAPSGALCLYGVLHPLFDLRHVRLDGKREPVDLMPPGSGARTPAAARRMASLVRAGEIALAMEVARSRYAMARAPLITSHVPWHVERPERLLAALMFPTSNNNRAALVQRWLRPQRKPQERAYA